MCSNHHSPVNQQNPLQKKNQANPKSEAKIVKLTHRISFPPPHKRYRSNHLHTDPYSWPGHLAFGA
jgi:hypothetical protein